MWLDCMAHWFKAIKVVWVRTFITYYRKSHASLKITINAVYWHRLRYVSLVIVFSRALCRLGSQA